MSRTFHFFLCIPVWILLFSGKTAPAADAGMQKMPAVPAVRLKVTPRSQGSGSNTERYWVLKALPSLDDVVAADPGLKHDLQEAIKAIRSNDGEAPGVWTLRFQDDRDFAKALQDRLNDTPGDRMRHTIYRPKVPPNPPESTDLTLSVDWIGAPVIHKPLEISMVIHGSQPVLKSPVATTLGEMEVHGVAGLTNLTPEDRRIPVTVRAGPETPSRTASWGSSEDHMAAFEIAAFAFNSAKKNGLQTDRPRAKDIPSRDANVPVENEVTQEIKRRYQLPGDWEAIPRDEGRKMVASDVKEDFGKNTPWKIYIALQAVEKVTFRIIGTRVDGVVQPRDAQPVLLGGITDLESRVMKDYKKDFENMQGRLVPKGEFTKRAGEITGRINKASHIVEAGVETHPANIEFTGLFQPRVTDFSAGIQYSTEKTPAGTLSLTQQNVLWKDALLKLSLSAGTEKQEGQFSFLVPYPFSPGGGLSGQFQVSAGYLQDDDQKLGTPGLQGFDEHRLTVAISNSLKFTKQLGKNEGTAAAPSGEPPLGGRYTVKLETGAGISSTDLDKPSGLTTEVESGEVLYLLADVQQAWTNKRRLRHDAGLGETELLWNARFKKGLNAGPGDFDFFAGSTSLTGTAYFGSAASRDYLLRLTAGGATVSGNAPVFEEFRLGGETTVRGMEEGERIAREVFYATVQAGVSAEKLWNALSHSVPKTKPSSPGGEKPRGLDLTNAYLNVFFDYASILRRSARSPAAAGGRNFESFGISVEMGIPGDKGNGRIELGYAWSPESIHERGRVFVAAHVLF